MGRDVLIAVLLALGLLAESLAIVGVLLMPHVFDRLHYLAPASSVGAPLLAGAVVAEEALNHRGIVTVLTASVLMLLSPVLTHAIARAARIRQFGDWRIQPKETVRRP